VLLASYRQASILLLSLQDLACSGVRAVASVLQARYAQGYRKSRDRSADGRDRLARSAMSSVCRQAFEQWAIIGKNPDDPGSKRRYSDFQAAMGGGSVQMETMGPDVTKQLQQLYVRGRLGLSPIPPSLLLKHILV
jgi:hypothetical protein